MQCKLKPHFTDMIIQLLVVSLVLKRSSNVGTKRKQSEEKSKVGSSNGSKSNFYHKSSEAQISRQNVQEFKNLLDEDIHDSEISGLRRTSHGRESSFDSEIFGFNSEMNINFHRNTSDMQ